MKGDERLPMDAGSGAEPRRSLLNPLYLLVCELAAARRLTAPPLSRTLKLPLWDGWVAELSTDSSGLGAPETVNHYALCLLRGDESRMHLGPFSPERVEMQDELITLLRAAIIIAEASACSGIDEDLLRDCAESLANAALGPRMRLSVGDGLMRSLGRAAELLQGRA